MRIRLKVKIVTLSALAVLVTLGLINGGRGTQAQSAPSESRILFGISGITHGQTARVNVVNTARSAASGACQVSVTFADGDGNQLLREGKPLVATANLSPGNSFFLEVKADEFLGSNEVRMNLRPVVSMVPVTPGDVHSTDSTIATLEVIDDATGQTAILNPGGIRGFNPQPDPPAGTPPDGTNQPVFGMVGLTRGQTARINIVAFPPGPTRVLLSFADADGNQLFSEGKPLFKVADLEAGHTTYLEINADNYLGPGDVRLNLRPVVIVSKSPFADKSWPPGPTVPSLEVIDDATGKTALMNPGVIRGFNPQPDPPATRGQ
jgi:hypothetical protein